MATTKVKPINLFVPFEKIERRESDDALIVEGYCFCNETVRGEGGICVKRSAMEAATPEYMRFGAVREMHQPIAAGTALQAVWDDKGCRLTAEIVDPVAKEKVQRKVYKGYSVSVLPTLMRGKDVEQLEWIENSLVDRPKDPDALFLHRAEGVDLEAEVEVETLPAVPSEPIAPSSPEESAPLQPGAELVPPPAVALPETGGADPSSPLLRVEPAAPSGASDEEVERVMMAAVEQALAEPEPVADAEPTSTWSASNVAATLLATPELETILRGQTSQTVPVRENLEGPRKPAAPTPSVPPIPKSMQPKPIKRYEVLDGTLMGVGAEKGYLYDHATSRGEVFGSPAEAAAEGERRERLERVIKKVGDKYCVYSEDGDKLGEHDTREEAEKQLAAIEADKKRGEKDDGDHEYRVEAGTPSPPAEAMLARMAEMRAEMARMEAALTNGTGVEPSAPPAPETASRPPDDSPALARLSHVEAELSRVSSAYEETRQRLATAEAEVLRLRNAPAAKPVIRYTQALSREFLANLGQEGEAELKVLRAAHDMAKKEAEGERDPEKRGRAVDRMMYYASALAQRGVTVE